MGVDEGCCEEGDASHSSVNQVDSSSKDAIDDDVSEIDGEIPSNVAGDVVREIQLDFLLHCSLPQRQEVSAEGGGRGSSLDSGQRKELEKLEHS